MVYVDRTLGGGSDLRSALRAVAGETGHRAGLLMVVGAGFDEDPTPFYIGFVDMGAQHKLGPSPVAGANR